MADDTEAQSPGDRRSEPAATEPGKDEGDAEPVTRDILVSQCPGPGPVTVPGPASESEGGPQQVHHHRRLPRPPEPPRQLVSQPAPGPPLSHRERRGDRLGRIPTRRLTGHSPESVSPFGPHLWRPTRIPVKTDSDTCQDRLGYLSRPVPPESAT